MAPLKLLRLNLGAGRVRLDGFLSVDVDPREADVAARIDALPFAPGTVETLYASHVLEHFLPEQTGRTALSLLRSWYDLLAPGGVLFVAVPDFEVLARIYASPGVAPSVRTTVLAAVFGGYRNRWDRHYAGYSRESLSELLGEAGFGEVTTFEPFANDETRHAIAGQPVSLNLRAVKAGGGPGRSEPAEPGRQAEDELTAVRRAADERLAAMLVQRDRIEQLEGSCAEAEAKCREYEATLASPRALLKAWWRAVRQ